MSRRCISTLAGPGRKVGQRRDGQTLEQGLTPVYRPPALVNRKPFDLEMTRRVIRDSLKRHGRPPRHALMMFLTGREHEYLRAA